LYGGAAINSGSFDLCSSLGITGVPSGNYCFNEYNSIACTEWRAGMLGPGALYDAGLTIHALDPAASTAADMLPAYEEGNPDAWPCQSGNTIYSFGDDLGTSVPNKVDLTSGCCGFCLGEYLLYSVKVTGAYPHFGDSGDYYMYDGKYWFMGDVVDEDPDQYFTPAIAFSEVPVRGEPLNCSETGAWFRCGDPSSPNYGSYTSLSALVTTRPACHLTDGLGAIAPRAGLLLENIGSGYWNALNHQADTGIYYSPDMYNKCVLFEDYECGLGTYDHVDCVKNIAENTTDCQKSMIKLTFTE
jgi:hypothetical protein